MKQRPDLTKAYFNDLYFSCWTLTSRVGVYRSKHRHQTLSASAQVVVHQSLDPLRVPKTLGLMH